MDDDYLAVIAHGLLNPMAAVLAGVATARSLLGEDVPADVEAMLEIAERQAAYVAESLRDLVLGIAPDVLAALDSIDLTKSTRE